MFVLNKEENSTKSVVDLMVKFGDTLAVYKI